MPTLFGGIAAAAAFYVLFPRVSKQVITWWKDYKVGGLHKLNSLDS